MAEELERVGLPSSAESDPLRNPYRRFALLARNRLGIWLLEILAEAFFFGLYLTVVLTLTTIHESSPAPETWTWKQAGAAVFGIPLIVLLIFGISGYALTSLLVRAFIKPRDRFLVSGITAALAMFHLWILLSSGINLTPNPYLRATYFLVVALIAFGCTFAGSRVLSKWRPQ